MSTSVYYQNVRWLRSKTKQLKQNLSCTNYDIICLTETNLNDGFHDAELSDEGFILFRRDRNYNLSGSESGGGCMIAVRNGIKVLRLDHFETNLNLLEDLWLKIFLPNGQGLYLCLTYITPFVGNTHLYDIHLRKLRANILSLDPKALFLIIGDYNCPTIRWNLSRYGILAPTRIDPTRNPNISSPDDLMHTIDLLNLNQYNHTINHKGNTLDLVLSNLPPNEITLTELPIPLVEPLDPAHPAFFFTIPKSFSQLQVSNPIKLNFRRGNYTAINSSISQTNWNFIDQLPTNDACDMMLSKLNNIINTHIPKIKSKRKYPPWFSFAIW